MAQVLGAASNGTFLTMSPSPALVGAQPASTNLSQWAGMGTNGNVPINIAGNAATVTSVSGNSVSSDQVTTGLGFTPLANTEAAITNTLGATLWKRSLVTRRRPRWRQTPPSRSRPIPRRQIQSCGGCRLWWVARTTTSHYAIPTDRSIDRLLLWERLWAAQYRPASIHR